MMPKNENDSPNNQLHKQLEAYPVKHVIFDLDGTLLYTLEDLADSVNHVMNEMGYPIHTIEQVRIYVGNGIRKLIERAVPTGTCKEDIDKTFTMFKIYYQEHCLIKTRLYDGIVPLLDELKESGIAIAVVSNKNQEALQNLCDQFFADYTDIIIGQKDTIPKKPAPDMVFRAMDRLNGTSQDTLYVGDSEVDAQTAENAGIPYALVTWGFRDRDVLSQWSPVAMIDHPMELLEHLRLMR